MLIVFIVHHQANMIKVCRLWLVFFQQHVTLQLSDNLPVSDHCRASNLRRSESYSTLQMTCERLLSLQVMHVRQVLTRLVLLQHTWSAFLYTDDRVSIGILTLTLALSAPLTEEEAGKWLVHRMALSVSKAHHFCLISTQPLRRRTSGPRTDRQACFQDVAVSFSAQDTTILNEELCYAIRGGDLKRLSRQQGTLAGQLVLPSLLKTGVSFFVAFPVVQSSFSLS